MSNFAVRNYQLTIDQGDTEKFNFVLKNSNGTSVDLSGYTAYMKIFWNVGRYPGTNYVVENGGELSVAGTCNSSGEIAFTLSPTVSSQIPISGNPLSIVNCQYNIKITSSDGSEVSTILAGPLQVYNKGF